jgi:hypothetical protein
MITLQRFAAGLCLLFGVPIFLLAATQILNPATAPEDRDGAIAALILFGIPPTALGGWLLRNAHQQQQRKQQSLEHNLEQLFLQMLQETGGRITPLRFASAAAIPLSEAQQFLDAKARQLNASFDTTDEGGIIYRFIL